MNTHDIELRSAVMGAITDVWDRAKQIDDAADEVLDLIEAAYCKRRGDPVDIRQEVIETLEMILAADWRKWEELASPDEFVRWAKSRANYALSIINAVNSADAVGGRLE